MENGSIVLSLAGHDKGRRFAVIGKADENNVFIADGRKRKLSAPKKKKIRHLKLLGQLPELPEGISNERLYRLIRDYI